ncbi:hypothetical protein [Saliphagus sp. LR7]|uniref:DUF7577 domain-containing protein n=1 Tax=Saliphagus sp. LR7 TaxID=2282654 RepID=UPI000DF72571|nr:hypothetical protein [Saliphagus sp. LR7]
MRSSIGKGLAWQLVGLLFYLIGMAVFLVIAVDVFVSPPEGSIENFTAGHLTGIVVSVVLLMVGRAISWKYGGEIGGLTMGGYGFGGQPGRAGDRDHPDQTVLEQHGYYQSPPDPEERPDEGGPGRGLESVAAEGTVCESCGTENGRGFDYCRNCAAEL